ncbi:hypothetical protein TNCV_2075341 [Trichonephila clavipes]|nr:hypothetical protein TNCV_2075341 [Trichonephila clavipes]
MAVKEISGSTPGIDFRRMIEDLTIGDTNIEMGVKRKLLVERTVDIGVRVRILVEINWGLHVLYHEIDTGDNPLVVPVPIIMTA